MSDKLQERQINQTDWRGDAEKMERISFLAKEVKEKKTKPLKIPVTNEETNSFLKEYGKELGAFAGSIGLWVVWGVLTFAKSLSDGLMKELVGKDLDDVKNWLKDVFSPYIDQFKEFLTTQFKYKSMRNLVDEIYKSGYFISVAPVDKNNGNNAGRFAIKKDRNENKVMTFPIDSRINPLEIFNDKDDPITAKVFEQVMIERAVTANGKNGVADLNEYINVNLQDPKVIDSLTPQQLKDAYLKMYAGKKMPAEIADFCGNLSNMQNTDMHFVKEALREYNGIVADSKTNLDKIREWAKEWVDGIMDVIKNPLQALSKVKDPLSLMFLIGWAAYGLFFSEHKKKFWMGLAAIYGGNALATMVSKDWKTGFDYLKQWSDAAFEAMDGTLKDKEYYKKLSEKPQELWIVLTLTTKPAKEVINGINIDAQTGRLEFNNYTIFTKEDTERLKKFYKNNENEYKNAINSMLLKFLQEAGKKWNETHQQVLARLQDKLNDPKLNPTYPFGALLLKEIGDIPWVNPSFQAARPETIASKFSIDNELNKIQSSTLKARLKKVASEYKQYKKQEDKSKLLQIIANAKTLPSISNSDKEIIENIERQQSQI